MKTKQTISVDFDGVLHAYTPGWKGITVIPDGSVPGAIAWLVELTDKFRVVVGSARASRLRGRWAIRAWLKRELFVYFGPDRTAAWDVFKSIKVTHKKPAAIVYVDDRAWRFDGKTFPTADDLYAHRPWCAKGNGP